MLGRALRLRGMAGARVLRDATFCSLRAFHDPEFWKRYYRAREGSADWFGANHAALRALAVRMALQLERDASEGGSARAILDVGCGTSPLGAQVLAALPGNFRLVAVDIEEQALAGYIDTMDPDAAGRVTLLQADVLSPGALAEGVRDALGADRAARPLMALDKGTLDAFVHAGGDYALPARYLAGVASALPPASLLVHASDEPPELRLDLLDGAARRGEWERPRFAGELEEGGVFAYTMRRRGGAEGGRGGRDAATPPTSAAT